MNATKHETMMTKERYGGIPGSPTKYTQKNCYDPVNDVCEMGHSAGTGSPQDKCCRYCNEFGQHPGGIVVIDGEEVFSK